MIETFPASGSRNVPLNGVARIVYCPDEEQVIDREAARLLGQSTSDVQRNRYAAAESLAEQSGQVVILKGARSIIAGAGELRVCAEGTPALGVAGTGDVLSGVVGALAMSLDPVDAAIAGALLHALAGVEASVGDRGLIASEVADAVPVVLDHIG